MAQSAYLNGLDPLANSAQPSSSSTRGVQLRLGSQRRRSASFVETSSAVQEPALIVSPVRHVTVSLLTVKMMLRLCIPACTTNSGGTGLVSLAVTQRLLSTSRLPPQPLRRWRATVLRAEPC